MNIISVKYYNSSLINDIVTNRDTIPDLIEYKSSTTERHYLNYLNKYIIKIYDTSYEVRQEII